MPSPLHDDGGPQPSSPLRKRHNTAVNPTTNNNSQKAKLNSARIREGIVQNNKKEIREQRRIARISHQSQASIQKFYLALIMNIMLVFMGGIVYWKPEFMFHNLARSHERGEAKLQWPPRHLAILYPPETRPQTDLPYFFQQYAIATPENQHTREAIRKLMGVRNRLKPFQVYVTAWEREAMVADYPMDEYCGAGFNAAYQHSLKQQHGIRHTEDLLVWCLLHTYQNDGFVQWNATLERSPMGASRHNPSFHYNAEDTLKGIVPAYPGQNRVHPSFLWLPKKRETVTVSVDSDGKTIGSDSESNADAVGTDITAKTKTKTTFDMNSQIPAKILPWLIHKAPTIPIEDYARASEEFLFQLVQEEREHWMILDAVCDMAQGKDPAMYQQQLDSTDSINRSTYENRRIMGRDCFGGDANSDVVQCCTVYMPEGDDTMTRQRLRQQRNLSSTYS